MKKPLMAAIAVVMAALVTAQPAEARDSRHHDHNRHGKYERHHYTPPKNMVLIKQSELKKLQKQAAKKAAKPKVVYYKPHYPRTNTVRYIYTPSGQWKQVAYYQYAPRYAYPRVSIW